jgi:hypothetical protein
MSNASKLCFVIGPIGLPNSDARRHADWLLKGIIRPVFSKSFPEFEVLRAEEISEPGSISSQVINRLLTAELVIADMSRANPNAFYEMGIRHMKRLPTIHMYLDGEDIPFDVKPYRAIAFKHNDPEDHVMAQAALKLAIEEVIKPGFVVENPVTQARGRDEFEETATPIQRMMLERLDGLAREVAELRTARQQGRSGASSDQTADRQYYQGPGGFMLPVDPYGGQHKI